MRAKTFYGPLSFSCSIFPTTKNFRIEFHTHIYAKLQNFIQLSANSTKLCRIKRDHLVNFYISLERRGKLRYFSNTMTDFHRIWHDDTERVFQAHLPLRINFQNPRWRTVETHLVAGIAMRLSQGLSASLMRCSS